MIEIVPFQEEFRQVLPTVEGNVDYEQFRDSLERIAELIKQSKIEQGVMIEALRQHQDEDNRRGRPGGRSQRS